MMNLLSSLGYTNINVEDVEIVYEGEARLDLYEAFLVASLQPYYRIIKNQSLCEQFKNTLRKKLFEEEPSVISHRLVILANKPK